MRDEELKELIVDKIRHAGVDFRAVEHLDAVAVINPLNNKGAFDKYVATPFNLSHEFFHKKFNHRKRNREYDVSNPQEHEANVAAANYLWQLFLSLGGTREYSQRFLDISGTPEYLLERLLEPVNN